MILARIGNEGSERPAVMDHQGRFRDIGSLVTDIHADSLPVIPADLVEALPVISAPHRFGVPVAAVRKFIAIGLNYREHAAEGGMQEPNEPVVFMKAISCLSGPDDDVPLPRGSVKMDWEVELGVVIGTAARYVGESEAMAHVAGFVLVNDLSERQDQLERGGSWDKGKSHDRFGPVGPFLVTKDGADWRGLSLSTRLNGITMQSGNTDDMIFGVPNLVAYCSRFMTLEPGDIIATGTPAGVGLGRKPEPLFLREGDVLELDGGPLGSQRQQIVAPL